MSSDIILYARSEKNYVEIITKTKRLVVRTSLDTFISELDDPLFIRVHRSFAVNMNKLTNLVANNCMEKILLFLFQETIKRRYKLFLSPKFNLKRQTYT